MEITQKLVERIAHLARLTLTEDEKARMRARLEDVLGSVTVLDRLRFEVEPPEQEGAKVLRPDEAGRGGEER